MITTPTTKMAPRPRCCSPSELKKVGVVLNDEKSVRLACEKCGVEWSPDVHRDGRLPRGYWMCPKGCNRSS